MDQTVERVLSDTRFYELLLEFDRDIATAVRACGCEKCGAALHWASFARKPRGVPGGLGPEHCQRLSLCCAAEGCRKRDTPSSLRFLGRKVFFGAMVVLITAMQGGLTPTRLRHLKAQVRVSARTVSRWRQWWRGVFAESPFWHAVGASLMPPIAIADLPASLLRRFAGEAEQPLILLLRFLAPVTTGAGLKRAI